MEFADFDAHIAPQIHNAPSILRQQTFWRAVRDFLRQTEALQADWEDAGDDDEDTYTPDIPENTLIERVKWVSLNDRVLPESIWRLSLDGDIEFDEGVVGDGDEIKARLVLNYTPAAADLDDAIGRDYFDALCDGTITHMKLMTNKPWTDLQSAPIHLARYTSAVNRAKRLADQSRQSGSLRVVPGRFL